MILQYYLTMMGPLLPCTGPQTQHVVLPPYITYLSPNQIVFCDWFTVAVTPVLATIYVDPTLTFEKTKLICPLLSSLTIQP